MFDEGGSAMVAGSETAPSWDPRRDSRWEDPEALQGP